MAKLQALIAVLVYLSYCTMSSSAGGEWLTCYVSPDPRKQPCPGVPCDTLSNYVSNKSLSQCLGDSASMEFLSGTHFLQEPVIVVNVTSLSFTGIYNTTDSLRGLPPEPSSQIDCTISKHSNTNTVESSMGAFVFSNTTNLTMAYLTLIGCGGFETKGCGPHAAVSFTNVSNLALTNITVRNVTGFGLCGSNTLGTSTIANSTFAYNIAQTHKPWFPGGNMKLYFRDCSDSFHSQFHITSSSFIAGTYDWKTAYASGLAVTITNCSSVHIEISSSVFSRNKANVGGNMAISFHNTASSFLHPVVVKDCYIAHGTAYRGGGLHVSIVEFGSTKRVRNRSNNSLLLHINNTIFSQNYAWGIAGGLYITHSESASASFKPMQVLIEDSRFEYNIKGYHSYPGGIAVHTSTISAAGYTLHTLPRLEYSFRNCNFTDSHDASNDGFSASVFLVEESSVEFRDCNFMYNECTALAGAGSSILLQGNISFHNNYAANGAGLLLCERSLVYLFPNTTVLFFDNHAQNRGGAIYAENECLQSVPPCFYQLSASIAANPKSLLQTVQVRLINNTAESAGTAIFGGSIEYCYFIETLPYDYIRHAYVFDHVFNITHKASDTSSVTSDPMGICLCDVTKTCNPNTTRTQVHVLPGKTFNILAVVIGQRNGSVPGVVLANTASTSAFLDKAEYVQTLHSATCASLNFTVFSSRSNETLALHPENPAYTKLYLGPRWVDVIFERCPTGFIHSNVTYKCDCIQLLQQNGIVCDINEQTIKRVAPAWIGHISAHSIQGVLFHSHCPFDYCKTENVGLRVLNETLEQDAQCAFHHRGILCGQCEDGLSLMLGSSRCTRCSNTYILLLPVFALAGILLVVMLFACNLTVSEGTINGLIFYANVVQLNNSAFFPPSPQNIYLKILSRIPVVFIAWLNLELGIEVCFYNGMDTYTRTWLQFAFPIYIWTIAAVLILCSRRYNSVARLLGKDAVKVLATLFLISYTKLQRAVIAGLSVAIVAYSEGPDRVVWLYDGSVQYLQGKHIPLFVFATIVGLLSLPYPFALFFITCLQKSPTFEFLFCVKKLKPLFDAYTGPYSDNCRFWPGLLLVARVVLLTVYPFNVFGNPKVNLNLSACVCIILLMTSWIFRGGIYKHWLLDILEGFFIANLGFLSVTTAYFKSNNWQREAFAYASFVLSLLCFIGIMAYHTQKAAKASRYCWLANFGEYMSCYRLGPPGGYEPTQNEIPEENNETNRELEETVDVAQPAELSTPPIVHRHFDRYREPLLDEEDEP